MGAKSTTTNNHCSTPRDDEEGEDNMMDMSSDEDELSGAVSSDHEYNLKAIIKVPSCSRYVNVWVTSF